MADAAQQQQQQQQAVGPAGGAVSPLPPGSSASSTTSTTTTVATSGYINKGLELWEQRRREWLSKSKEGGPAASAASSSAPKRARSVDVDTIIESIFSTNGDSRLPQPVPLSQMIDLLVDFWEADGLFD